jgi:ribonuclease P protein component
MASPPRARSSFFVLYFREAEKIPPERPRRQATTPTRQEPSTRTEFSTDTEQVCDLPVDNSVGKEPCSPRVYLGCVIPKKMVKRAVTRNLIKRQMRVLFDAPFEPCPAGQWVLRMKAPLDTRRFISADSPGLRAWVRLELHALMKQALQKLHAPQRRARE